jgi:hypothetical protein
MNMLASATVISELTSDLAGYSTAAFALVAAVIALKVGIKWVKGLSSRAS